MGWTPLSDQVVGDTSTLAHVDAVTGGRPSHCLQRTKLGPGFREDARARRIATFGQLRRLGSVAAYGAVKDAGEPVSLNRL